MGCPIAKHLPASVASYECEKRSQFPELKYEITAQATRAEFDTYVESLRTVFPDAKWEVTSREDIWMSVTFYNSAFIGNTSWHDGTLTAGIHAF